MKIQPSVNDSQFGAYNAHLVKYEVGSCDIKHGHIVPPNSMIPINLTPSVSTRKLVLIIDFIGTTKHDITLNISRFTELLLNGADLLLPDGFIYTCAYLSASAAVEKAPWIYQVKFTLEGYRHGTLETINLTDTSGVFNADGNCNTPAIIEICASSEGDNGTIMITLGRYGSTTRYVSVTNVTGSVIIDGYKKTITENGHNKFLECDIAEFPMLYAGYNQYLVIHSFTHHPNVVIKYYPIYV